MTDHTLDGSEDDLVSDDLPGVDGYEVEPAETIWIWMRYHFSDNDK